MATVSIDLDGRIELIDRRSDAGGASDASERTRGSRLNDVMIVLEHAEAELTAALAARLAGEGLLGGAFDGIRMSFGADTPTFHAVIATKSTSNAAPLDGDRAQALEAAIAAEVLDQIERRAGRSEGARWEPRVTVTCRRSEHHFGSLQGRLWLNALFWLLGAVILGVAYLWLKGHPSGI